MIMDQITSIALACITSAGGVGAIILGVIKLSSNTIASNLEKKYELRMNKELELYKAGVGNKIYISKTKFDTEFQLYRQLSNCFTRMVKEVAQLFPVLTKDMRNDHEAFQGMHNRALDAIVLAQDELCSSAPFISKGLYEKFLEIENLCKHQLSDFQDFRLRPDAKSYQVELNKEYREAYNRTRKINQKLNELLEELRDYISKLDVIE